MAISYREGNTVWRCLWSALARARNKTFSTRTYTIDIVDQVGRGDSFTSWFLCCHISADDMQKGLDVGVAFVAWKHRFFGDFNCYTKEEVESLLASTKYGRSRQTRARILVGT